MISGKKTKNLLKKAQTGKHKHTHKKSTRNSTEKKHKLRNTLAKDSTAKSTKKSTNCQTYTQKKAQRKTQKTTTNYQTQAQKIVPTNSGQTSFPEPASWPTPCLRQKFPELEPAPQASLWGSCVWPLTPPPPRNTTFRNLLFATIVARKKAPARTQECTPSRLTPKRQTFDLASEVRNSSLHPV